MRRFVVLLIIGCLLAACSEQGVATVTAPAASSTAALSESTAAEPTATTFVQTPVTPAALPEPTPSAAATAAPTAEPITSPLLVAADGALPAAVQAEVERVIADEQTALSWVETGSDVVIRINEGEAVAHWIYAAVSPFPTIVDEISSADLRAAWDAAELLVDAETAAVFSSFWGEPAVSAATVAAEELAAALWQRQVDVQTPALALVPFERLVPELKVLAVDGLSPLAAVFDPAGYSLTIPFGLVGDPHGIELLAGHWPEPFSNRQDSKITQIAMTGPAGMRRAVADRMEKYGLTYPAEVTGPVLQAVDIAHMSNENAFASDCPLPDPFDSVNVCNRDEYVELMTWMGIDINEMTGNHLNDWGADSLLHTFDLYDQVGIQTFGGGRNLAAAQEPLLIEHNGNHLAFVGCNPVGPPNGWAGENYPGALPCADYEFILNQISELDAAGYLVFATLQYLEDYQYEVLASQRTDFHNLAAAGATAVSGSHAHHPQGFSFFAGSFIHYGLGNMLADQMFSLGTRQTFIDIYTVYDGRLFSVELWTGMIEDYARQRLMTAEERQDLLRTVFQVSDWACCQ